MISIIIPGTPRSTQTGSIITVKGRSFPLRRNTPWSAYCRLMMQANAPKVPLDGPISVHIQFVLPRPKATKRSLPWVRPDLENLAKGLLDCGNELLWHDDGQICFLNMTKSYAMDGEQPGIILNAKDV